MGDNEDIYVEMEPVTPGEILRTEFLEPLNITAYRLAIATGMTQTRVSQLLKGKRAITADTAQRLSRALGGSAQSWINLQTNYDLLLAERVNAERYAQIEPLVHPSAA